MTKYEAEQRERFLKRVTEESPLPYSKARALGKLLLRHGKTYSRIMEGHCNGCEWLQGDTNESHNKRQERLEKWLEKREGQLERHILAIVTELSAGRDKPIAAELQGDPRGNTIKLWFTGQIDPHGTGYGVPTS